MGELTGLVLDQTSISIPAVPGDYNPLGQSVREYYTAMQKHAPITSV
jgi:hypothetical protein